MSKGVQIPINPEVLLWARKRAGYKIDQLAEDFPKLLDWENGSSNPTYCQLDSLAKKYKITMAVLFFPNIPKETPIEKSLRAVSGTDVDQLTPKVRFLFRKGEAFQIYLKELFEDDLDNQLERVNWLKSMKDSPIIDMANNVRKILNISTETQISWKNEDEALSSWREALATNGIYVFKESFEDSNISGFCIYDELFPIIYVNNSQSKSRQIFTVIHELGHLMSKENFLDTIHENILNVTESSSEEVKCNSFAGHVLVPDVEIRTRYDQSGLDTNIERLAKIFSVSKDVILRKLFETGLISKNEFVNKFNEWQKIFSNTNNKNTGGGNYYATQLQYIGKSYCILVLKKYYQGKIDVAKASEYLDIKPKSFPGIEKRLIDSGSLDVYI